MSLSVRLVGASEGVDNFCLDNFRFVDRGFCFCSGTTSIISSKAKGGFLFLDGRDMVLDTLNSGWVCAGMYVDAKSGFEGYLNESVVV